MKMDADRATDKAKQEEEARKKVAEALMAVRDKANGQNVMFDPFGKLPLTKKLTILGSRG